MQGQRSPLRRRWRTRPPGQGKNPSAQMLSAPARADHTSMRAPASAWLEFDCADLCAFRHASAVNVLGEMRRKALLRSLFSLPAVPPWWEAWKLVDT